MAGFNASVLLPDDSTCKKMVPKEVWHLALIKITTF